MVIIRKIVASLTCIVLIPFFFSTFLWSSLALKPIESTTEVAYQLGYFKQYYQLRNQVEQILNKIEDKALIKLDQLRINNREDLAEALQGKIYDELDEAKREIDDLFESVDKHVVLQGEKYDLAYATLPVKIKLIRHALTVLLGTVRNRIHDILISF